MNNTPINREFCIHCGDSTAFGSGKFVNRIPCGDSIEENIEAGRAYPNGEWICDECEKGYYKDRLSDTLLDTADTFMKAYRLHIGDDPLDGDQVAIFGALFTLHLDFINGNITSSEFDESYEQIKQEIFI